MVNTSKKIAAGLLALTFVFGGAALPTGVVSNNTVISASADSYQGFEYTIQSDGTICIDKYSSSLDTVIIPEEINGYTVTSIGEFSFWYNTSIKSLTIPKTVKSIGDYAFAYCPNLESVTLNDGLQRIQPGVFHDCEKLKNITIPSTVKTIGQSAFSGCHSLEEVTISDGVQSVGRWAFDMCNKLKEIIIPNSVINISDSAFRLCESLESVTLSKGVTRINEGTFSGCKSLKNINNWDSVVIIGKNAFSGCSSLDKLIIPESVETIDDSAFTACSNLNEVIIPDSVITINDFAFNHCPKLKSVTIPKSVTNIGAYVFDGSSKDFVINCYTNTAAHKYAEENNINYVLLDAPEPEPQVTTPYPEVINIEYSPEYHKVRLTWTPVDGADKYGIAAFIAGKWRVQTYTDKTTFTSPKLKAGDTYKLLIAARVNGEWDLSNINSRAFTVTVK